MKHGDRYIMTQALTELYAVAVLAQLKQNVKLLNIHFNVNGGRMEELFTTPV